MFDFEQMAQWKIFKRPTVEAALAKAGLVQMLHWKLLRGSHEFPGPDGGTCINEAAIIAAGYAYRAVKSANDCPPCFSRPCSAYALALNDYIDDDRHRRRLLMPFVARLAGSADTLAVERQRAGMILLRSVTDLLLPRFAGYRRHPITRALSRVKTPFDAMMAAASLGGVIQAPKCDSLSMLMVDACEALSAAATAYALDDAQDTAMQAARFADRLAREMARIDPQNPTRAVTRVYARAAAILDAALKLGKQPDSIPAESVFGRLQEARAEAHEQNRVAA
ncbi:MAG TPA: hypothetical protein VN930_11370 [Xanthobacteraceae bacterium]|nr:hypothetical protein [Xanthobacteraceae bacterium]